MYVRDDDVFLMGGRYKNPNEGVERFKKVHKLIVEEGAVHIVALICGTLHQFPAGINFLKEVYFAGELIPEIHGWQHIDYALLNKVEIVEHLNRCIDLIENIFNYRPTKFYTPWGANALHIKEASEMVGLIMVDCSNILYPKKVCFGGKNWREYSQKVRSGEQELFIHWYQDKWFKDDNYSLVKTLRTVRENRNFFNLSSQMS